MNFSPENPKLEFYSPAMDFSPGKSGQYSMEPKLPIRTTSFSDFMAVLEKLGEVSKVEIKPEVDPNSQTHVDYMARTRDRNVLCKELSGEIPYYSRFSPSIKKEMEYLQERFPNTEISVFVVADDRRPCYPD